jgi:hypothetical protein
MYDMYDMYDIYDTTCQNLAMQKLVTFLTGGGTSIDHLILVTFLPLHPIHKESDR